MSTSNSGEQYIWQICKKAIANATNDVVKETVGKRFQSRNTKTGTNQSNHA